jgi:hypothetical protein
MDLSGRSQSQSTPGGDGFGTGKPFIGEGGLFGEDLHGEDYQSSFRIGFDHPQIVLNTFCPYCSFFDRCLSSSFTLGCERPNIGFCFIGRVVAGWFGLACRLPGGVNPAVRLLIKRGEL